MGYDKARRISRLVIADERGRTAFEYPRPAGRGKGSGKCRNCGLRPEDWEKIGYTEEMLEEAVKKRTGKRIEELDGEECARLRDWLDKVYEKRQFSGPEF